MYIFKNHSSVHQVLNTDESSNPEESSILRNSSLQQDVEENSIMDGKSI